MFFLVGLLGAWQAGAFLGYPDGWAKPMIVAIEVSLLPTLVLVLALLLNGAPARSADSSPAPDETSLPERNTRHMPAGSAGQ